MEPQFKIEWIWLPLPDSQPRWFIRFKSVEETGLNYPTAVWTGKRSEGKDFTRKEADDIAKRWLTTEVEVVAS